MPADCLAVWVPRQGHSREEYEDAFAADQASGRYAVADGATESSFARLWAKLLVRSFLKTGDLEIHNWPASLCTPQEQWDVDIRSRELPWYAEAPVKQGAFATFLGVVLAEPFCGPCCWRAVAIGDTAVFHIRDDKLIEAFPIKHSTEFGTIPELVGSRTSVDVATSRARWCEGWAELGDRLWIMTDALAAWFLAAYENSSNPCSELLSVLTPANEHGFGAWIEGLRDSGNIDNDDVTLLAIHL